jgi:hypothetical protein
MSKTTTALIQSISALLPKVSILLLLLFMAFSIGEAADNAGIRRRIRLFRRGLVVEAA